MTGMASAGRDGMSGNPGTRQHARSNRTVWTRLRLAADVTGHTIRHGSGFAAPSCLIPLLHSF